MIPPRQLCPGQLGLVATGRIVPVVCAFECSDHYLCWHSPAVLFYARLIVYSLYFLVASPLGRSGRRSQETPRVV